MFYVTLTGLISICWQCIDVFVDDLRWEEADTSKHDKIRELKLTRDEWARVSIFLGLLAVCGLYQWIQCHP